MQVFVFGIQGLGIAPVSFPGGDMSHCEPNTILATVFVRQFAATGLTWNCGVDFVIVQVRKISQVSW
jgi:hypothetical protein